LEYAAGAGAALQFDFPQYTKESRHFHFLRRQEEQHVPTISVKEEPVGSYCLLHKVPGRNKNNPSFLWFHKRMYLV
jgi:hypothetical protein